MSKFKELHTFEDEVNKTWSNLLKGEENAEKVFFNLSNLNSSINITSNDASLVVFGSLARNEYSNDSDLDWTLLIDAQANDSHNLICQGIRNFLKSNKFKEPGTSGMFGNITFSHDLIHYIGGEEDTNCNLSRRLLLLLESEVINRKEGDITAYDRVLRGIIHNYIEYDSGLRNIQDKKIPRFLLNDFVRFWRTMCVDFANKQKEQEGKKWAIRNIKLRMSRKIIYIKGLLMCFCCTINNDLKDKNELKLYILELAKSKPIDLLISSCKKSGIDNSDIIKLLDIYDDYLEQMHNQNVRNQLETLDLMNVYEDETFLKCRRIADDFHEQLSKVFFNKDNLIGEFIYKYGVF